MLEPILITGTFRSGTTLISQIMRNHSNVELVYDSVNFMRFSYNKYNPITEFENVKLLVKEIHERIQKRWEMEFNYEEVISKLKDEKISYAIIYDKIMTDLLLKNSEANIWGEKTTLVWTKIPDFFELFPKGRVIHIIRDPRAVLASWKKMTHAPGNDYLDAILNCRGSMEKALEYKNRFKSIRYYLLKYEKLVKNPKRELKNISKKLGIKFEGEMINSKNFTDKTGDKWQGNSMHLNNINGITKKTKDKWKNNLLEWEVSLTDYLISDLFGKFGYEKIICEIKSCVLDTILKESRKSDLVSDGLLRYLFTNNGHERFPEDPLDPNNWEE